ncbi:hypothetical protein LX99_04927 [Mucilaginibacter oryzae]|uniref:Uncharacterized protein n=1 Tax=Mucilaginibacter oryzae TaxID=468058 RepID=A0A316HAS8_9SPHI|nr:hypothetical protein LX99_04927 [Mucilaginibacter oryzae]
MEAHKIYDLDNFRTDIHEVNNLLKTISTKYNLSSGLQGGWFDKGRYSIGLDLSKIMNDPNNFVALSIHALPNQDK